MEWFKRNWLGIAVVVLTVIVLLYWYNSKKVDPKKKIYLTKQARVKGEMKEGQRNIQVLESALNRCGQEYSNVRMAVTAETHPCYQINKQLELEKNQVLAKKG